MHMASYLDVPVVALFGPTNPVQYGPWGTQGRVVERKAGCPVCRSPHRGGIHSCMEKISVEDVMDAFEINAGRLVLK